MLPDLSCRKTCHQQNHPSSKMLGEPPWKFKVRGTGVIFECTPKHCDILREILQNDHSFPLFDPPKKLIAISKLKLDQGMVGHVSKVPIKSKKIFSLANGWQNPTLLGPSSLGAKWCLIGRCWFYGLPSSSSFRHRK